MGEFVSNIYESMKRNNDMYIIWSRRPERHLSGQAGGRDYAAIITLFFGLFQ